MLGKPSGSGSETRTLTVALLSTEAEVVATEQRLQAQAAAADAAKAALARAALEDVTAISIEGAPLVRITPTDGVYRLHSEHEGWPVLKNARGMYCYRYMPRDEWFLRDEFTTDESACYAAIEAEEGPLPVGAHTWRVSGDNDWEEHALTVTLR